MRLMRTLSMLRSCMDSTSKRKLPRSTTIPIYGKLSASDNIKPAGKPSASKGMGIEMLGESVKLNRLVFLKTCTGQAAQDTFI